MKKNSHNEGEPFDKQHFKKKYILRKYQEHEAEKEIHDWTERDGPTEVSDSQRLEEDE